MRIFKEEELLDPGVRRKIIEEIEGPENKARKEEAFKRHMCLKDQTQYFVIEQLRKQFDDETIREMNFAVSNVSVVKKVIDKLARVFSNGVERSVITEDGEKVKEESQKLQKIAEALDLDQVEQTNNKYLKLQKNSVLYLKPCPEIDDMGNEVYSVVPQVMPPYLYDAVESQYDRTQPVCHIFSNYEYGGSVYTSSDPSREGRGVNSQIQKPLGDGKDQTIADTKMDEDAQSKQYIWWSGKYHFTTDHTGMIIDGSENPIGMSPVIDYGIDRDNSYWSQGGNDLCDEAISINCLLSHISNIGVIQGYGQFYMIGKSLPRNQVFGPNKAVILEYEGGPDNPVPQIGFVNANPNIDSLMRILETKVALLLTTNNLSTRGVSLQLNQESAAPSGISLIIDKAESLEDINEQRKLFTKNEKKIFKVINAWLKLFSSTGQLCESLQGLQLEDNFNMTINFPPPSVIMSEQEKLDLIKSYKDLGLSTDLDLIKKLYPELTELEAQGKLDEIKQNKQSKIMEMSQMMGAVEDAGNEENNSGLDKNNERAGSLFGSENQPGNERDNSF